MGNLIKNISVRYKYNLYTENGKIDNDGWSGLKVINQGTSIVTMSNVLKIQPGKTFELHHRPGEIIDDSPSLMFENDPNLINSVVVVRYYYFK